MQRNPIAKRYHNLYKSSFQIGFECEFNLITNRLSEPNAASEVYLINPSIEWGSDCSIEPDEDDCHCSDYRTCNLCSQVGIEVRTPPLPAYDSMLVLKKMFQFISKYGTTNWSCGLHANFSPMSDEVYYSVNPYKIFNNPLWEQMKLAFDRSDNEYCETTPWNYSGRNTANISTPLERFLNNQDSDDEFSGGRYDYDGHCSEVNFDNYYNPRRSDSRIEIRCMGNADYHKKFPLVAHYVNQTIEVFRTGYGKAFD